MTTPADLAHEHDERRIRHAMTAAVRAERVASWNRQMEAVVRVLLDADALGCGIIIDVSDTHNRISARTEPHAPKGLAYVFDHDRGTVPYTRTVRLAHLPKD